MKKQDRFLILKCIPICFCVSLLIFIFICGCNSLYNDYKYDVKYLPKQDYINKNFIFVNVEHCSERVISHNYCWVYKNETSSLNIINDSFMISDFKDKYFISIIR